jgi:hypothetical protein
MQSLLVRAVQVHRLQQAMLAVVEQVVTLLVGLIFQTW